MELPDAFPVLVFANVDEFLLEMQQHDLEIKAGVALVGDPADYGEVWEWGNRRQKKAGPRTVLGTNPKGESVWLSSQAPFGWIRINEPFLHKIVDDVMEKVEFDQPNARAITQELERAAKKISKGIADVLKMSVPVDSGALRKAIVPLDPNDAVLDQEIDQFDTLELNEAEE